MNTANLQLEGLVMAMASINQLLVTKGLLTTEDVDRALGRTEQDALGSDRAAEDLSPSNRDAIVFPVRILRLANNMAGEDAIPPFSELAKTVAQTKGRHNDQE